MLSEMAYSGTKASTWSHSQCPCSASGICIFGPSGGWKAITSESGGSPSADAGRQAPQISINANKQPITLRIADIAFAFLF
jgi:hypothetical protein